MSGECIYFYDLTTLILISADVIFAAARLAVSLIVLVAWNYLLQRNFVYRPTRFDRYAIEAVDVLTAGRLKRSRYGGGE